MASASTSDLERAKRVYGDLVRTVLDLATECPESRHVAALAIIVDAFHDDVLRPLECGRWVSRATVPDLRDGRA